MTLGEGVFVCSWFLIAVVLVLDLAGMLHRGTAFRVQAAGLLVMNTAQVVNLFAHLHSRRVFPALLAGFAIFIGGVILSARQQRTAKALASEAPLRDAAPLDRQ